MFSHYIFLNCILSAFSVSITNVTDIQENKSYHKKYIDSLDLNAGDSSEEFKLTKLFDIRLKGSYDHSSTDVRDVIRSQIQPDLGQNVSGIYEIQPKLSEKPLMVLCDMETMDGGWAHIQRRLDGSQDFYLGWREYKFGFGNLNGEFWLGLKNIYIFTASEASELLVEIVDRDNVKAYAHYTAFGIGSEVEGYPLSILKNCSGDAGDALSYHLGHKFTTKDFDQDISFDNCALLFSGAWWYKSCHESNLNGKYLNSVLPEKYKSHGLHWVTFRGPYYCHAKARMLIRPT